MNLQAACQLRHLFARSEWLTRTRAFATALRTSTHRPGDLLLVGTPDYEPWHFAAHLSDAARLTGQPQLAATLVRHSVPAGARPHLAVDLSRLAAAAHGQTVLVVAPADPTTALLERIDDARRAGAAIFSIDSGDPDLQTLAHEALVVTDPPAGNPATPLMRVLRNQGKTPHSLNDAFDAAQHLVSLSTTEQPTSTFARIAGI